MPKARKTTKIVKYKFIRFMCATLYTVENSGK